MKKVLLGLVLLALLGLISYLQMEHSAERRAEAWVAGHEMGQHKAELDQPNFDSLLDLVELERSRLSDLRATFETTDAEKEAGYQVTIDSLAARIEAQQKEIGRLQQQLVQAKARRQPAASAAQASSAKSATGDIIGHYRLAVAKLPADLSAYEQRVAVEEIRTETAQKFQITVQRLNQLREENNLDY
jgi:hypothetical protein